jgi:hypothetical protein
MPSDPPIIAELQKSGDRVRAGIKWLIAAFAAIGAALIAGSQFASIGHLTGWRLVAAAGGAALAITFLARAIWLLFDLMMPSEASITPLAQQVKAPGWSPAKRYILARPEVLLGFDTVPGLRRRYLRALRARRRLLLDYYDSVIATGDESHPAVAKALVKAKAADGKLGEVEWAVGYLAKLMSLEELNTQVRQRKWQIFGASLLVAVGLGLFTWGANPPSKKEPAASRLQLVGVHLEGAQLRLAQLAGSDMHGAHLQHAVLVGANLVGVDLSGADLVAANLRGSDLRGAKLQDVTWGDTICPDGTNSNTHEDGCASHRSPK